MNYEDWIKEESGLGETLSAFNLFSVFLEWNIMDPTTPDLAYIPIEYIRYIGYAGDSQEVFCEIVLLVMLFSEHIQLTFTGTRKVQLEEKKYHQIAEHFTSACQLELLKRENIISKYNIQYLFNPNIKTEVRISNPDFKKLPKPLQTKIALIRKDERISEQQ